VAHRTRYGTFFRLWLAGTLVFVLVAAFVLRPDRDVARYMEDRQAEGGVAGVTERQVTTHMRLLEGEGLTPSEITERLLINGTRSGQDPDEIMAIAAALRTKDEAERRLTLFAAFAFLPPLLVLELATALLWARRRYQVCARFVDAVAGRAPAPRDAWMGHEAKPARDI
jgi:hypothetical protein